MLDSSPVILQQQQHPQPAPPRRNLKRSASTASLPTPPRTANDKKRARKERPASESDDDDDTFAEPVARVLFGPKASSMSQKESKKVVEENPFWVAAEEEETESPGPKLRKNSTVGSAPASPPLSRTNQVVPRLATPPASTKPARKLESPKTPVQTKREEPNTASEEEESGGLPVLVDSPNNPFVASSNPSTPKGRPREATPDLEEKPTVTYVFRGKRIEFTNPLYHLPAETFEKSRLPVEHEDYSPPPIVKPKRLFKEETKVAARRRRAPASPTQTTPTRTMPVRTTRTTRTTPTRTKRVTKKTTATKS